MPVSADYLKKYLTAGSSQNQNGDFEDSSRPKKRRKKDKSNNLVIADEDDGLRLNDASARNNEEEDGPLVYATKQRSAEFRKKKNSVWQSVSDAPDTSATTVQDDADAILASAAEESAARRAEIEAEDAPAIVTTEVSGPRMSSGAKAGLQTIEDSMALAAEEERRESKAKKSKSRKDEEVTQETIYRDATGRRIDISLRRQEIRAQEAAKLAAEKKERENAMGDVQLQQKAQAKEDFENAKFLTLGRSAEDEELNQAQKEELRWEDPMAQYMAERDAEKEAEELAKNPSSRREQKDGDIDVPKVKKRQYLGAAPPNRYGIKPGWRWDGVDRGNGFEKEWFQARGKKSRVENLEYQWQMDE